MLLDVRNDYPSGSQFTFNYYCYWYTLLVSDTGDGSSHFLHSKEVVTRRDPLSMIAYIIGVLPLIREFQRAHPRVTQLWYADDAVAGGKFEHIQAHLRDFLERGPSRGYYPEPTKSFLVLAPGMKPGCRSSFAGCALRL